MILLVLKILISKSNLIEIFLSIVAGIVIFIVGIIQLEYKKKNIDKYIKNLRGEALYELENYKQSIYEQIGKFPTKGTEILTIRIIAKILKVKYEGIDLLLNSSKYSNKKFKNYIVENKTKYKDFNQEITNFFVIYNCATYEGQEEILYKKFLSLFSKTADEINDSFEEVYHKVEEEYKKRKQLKKQTNEMIS